MCEAMQKYVDTYGDGDRHLNLVPRAAECSGSDLQKTTLDALRADIIRQVKTISSDQAVEMYEKLPATLSAARVTALLDDTMVKYIANPNNGVPYAHNGPLSEKVVSKRCSMPLTEKAFKLMRGKHPELVSDKTLCSGLKNFEAMESDSMVKEITVVDKKLAETLAAYDNLVAKDYGAQNAARVENIKQQHDRLVRAMATARELVEKWSDFNQYSLECSAVELDTCLDRLRDAHHTVSASLANSMREGRELMSSIIALDPSLGVFGRFRSKVANAFY
jgi:hypothetical protein